MKVYKLLCVVIISFFWNVYYVHSYNLTSSLAFITPTQNGPILTCGGEPWTKDHPVALYLKNNLIFISTKDYNNISTLSMGSQDPYILKTINDTYIVLANRTSGWEELFCVNVKNERSQNFLTIPYISEVKLYASMDGFKLNHTLNLLCDGAVSPPNPNTELVFKFNGKLIATIRNNQLISGNMSGIDLNPNAVGNNSITFVPTHPHAYGEYSCALRLPLQGKDHIYEAPSTPWNTAGVSTQYSFLVTEFPYFRDDFRKFVISCNKTKFDNVTNVKFFNDKWLLYDSSSTQSLFANATADNRSVIIKAGEHDEYQALSCSINNTQNANLVSVSRLYGPNFSVSPNTTFEVGRNYTLKCSGYMQPFTSLITSFVYNGIPYAMLVDGKLTILDQVPAGLRISRVNKSNDTISIEPTLVTPDGTYSCLFLFDDQVVPSADTWVTSRSKLGTSGESISLTASILALLLCFIAVGVLP